MRRKAEKKQGAEQKKPNIVLVMADDQGWGDMAYSDLGNEHRLPLWTSP